MKKFVLMLALALPLGAVALAQNTPKTEKTCCNQKGHKEGDKQAGADKTGSKKAGEACCKTGDKQGKSKKQGACCKEQKGQAAPQGKQQPSLDKKTPTAAPQDKAKK